MPKKLGAWKEASKNRNLINFNEIIKENTVKVNVSYNLPAVKGTKVKMTYIITNEGAIKITTSISTNSKKPPFIPRIGTNLRINKEFNIVNWLGRGPHENYQDRKSSALVGLYQASVQELYVPYIRPQENGYRTAIRWVSFKNNKGNGIKIHAPKYFNFSAHHQYNDDFDAGKTKKQRHTIDIINRDFVNINIDMQQMGIGGDNSWGAMPLKKYRIHPKYYSYEYTIAPLNNN